MTNLMLLESMNEKKVTKSCLLFLTEDYFVKIFPSRWCYSTFLLISLFSIFSSHIFSQNKTNTFPPINESRFIFPEKLNFIAAKKEWYNDSIKYTVLKDSALLVAKKFGYPVSGMTNEGTSWVIDGFDDSGMLRYISDYNKTSAIAIKAHEVHPDGDASLNLTGNGINLGVWEVGRPRLTHVELNNKIIQKDNSNATVSNHASHVSGTMAGKGINSNAKGMAFQATLDSYDSANDIGEMRAAAGSPNFLRLSNHSYGQICGWRFNSDEEKWYWYGDPNISQIEDYKFGFYSTKSQQFDKIVFDHPWYLPVFSAGNDRNDFGPKNGESHYAVSNNQWVLSSVQRNKDGGASGYDCIPETQTSKNILTVGAIEFEYLDGLEISGMTSFSSWGPTDDGRIKPDIVARGFNVFSCGSNSNNAYYTTQGTSMAAPSVTGALGLIHQHTKNLFNGGMFFAAGLKALVIHTADYYGGDGPNYKAGWGLMNTRKAIDFISNVDDDNRDWFSSNDTLFQNETREINFYHDGESEVKITIAWTDVPGQVTSPILNSKQKKLINDLDLRLINNGEGNTYFPWKLNPDLPNSPATKGDNSIDNVEQIFEENLPPGHYTIRISHKGNLNEGNQPYAIMLSGWSFAPICATPTGLKTSSVGYSHIGLEWNQVENVIGYQTRNRKISEDWKEAPVFPSLWVTFGILEPNVQYEFQVRSKCDNDTFSDWSSSIFVHTEGAGDPYCYSYGLSWHDYISRVSIGDFINNSDNGLGYTNYQHLHANVEKSKTYEIKLMPTHNNEPKNMHWKVWIDYNKNNSFNDPGELVFSRQANNIGEISGLITIPSSVLSGITRLRVVMSESEITGPCQINSFSDVEDYSINIIENTQFLTVSTNTINLSAKETSSTFTLQTNCSWEIRNVPSWMNLNQNSGTHSATINIQIQENNTPLTRNATIEVLGCNGLEQIITITQLGCISPSTPLVTSNKLSLCPGETALLTITNPCSECTYMWNNNTTGVSLNVNQSGIYSVTSNNGCTSVNSNEIEITQNQFPPKPILTLDGEIKLCDGESRTITLINPCQDCSILWSNGQISSGITVNSEGSYSAKYINSCGESDPSNTILVVRENFKPVIVVNNNCYLAGPNGGLSYQWFLNGINITGATLQFLIAEETGYYTLQMTNQNNCKGTSEATFISGCVSAIENETNINKIKVFPNPVTDELFINLSPSINSRFEGALITTSGKLIKSFVVSEQISRINIEELPSGTYFLKLSNRDNILYYNVLKI